MSASRSRDRRRAERSSPDQDQLAGVALAAAIELDQVDAPRYAGPRGVATVPDGKVLAGIELPRRQHPHSPPGDVEDADADQGAANPDRESDLDPIGTCLDRIEEKLRRTRSI